jgi:hypothetical protein
METYYCMKIDGIDHIYTAVELGNVFNSMQLSGKFPSITSLESISRPAECLGLGKYFQVGWELQSSHNPLDTGSVLEKFLNQEKHVRIEVHGKDQIRDFFARLKKLFRSPCKSSSTYLCCGAIYI